MEYVPTIGLEIHAELRTRTKMFCSSINDADETRPNVNICQVCMAHPGTLPAINKEAVRSVLRVGVALGSRLADYTEFDRKSYFYPDLPKGYQLSQYEYPLVSGGALKGVEITRVHLEEDTASSIHDDATGATLIDYNRAGVPLMELVTEPVIHSAEQAGEFARELQLMLRYLGVSNANMEKGEMRVEANVSISNSGTLGTKVEIKNINSFNVMERAVRYELRRQEELLRSGGTVVQETRGWDDAKQQTFAQRVKEGSADYRYFPDPDLPSLKLSELPGFDAETLQATLPELPHMRRERYLKAAIKPDDADLYVRDTRFGDFFDEVSSGYDADASVLASNYIANDLIKIVRDRAVSAGRDTLTRDSDLQSDFGISATHFRKLIDMIRSKKISSRAAKDILAEAVSTGADPEAIATKKGLLQTQDAGALESAVQGVIDQNPTVVADYKAGKEAALQFLLGQCMKILRGAADPVILRDLLKQKLS
ncbi:MAG: gatB [Candidatus Kaiserbacteria bacterium]|nr:gatB [Candidatus Kaiserbacteria bacterium]